MCEWLIRKTDWYSTPDLDDYDIEMIARSYASCDIVLVDIEAGTPDQRVLEVLKMCSEIEISH
ncbi:MAG: hypothetical protein ACYSWW_04535 [Planctomycetota bacterium]